VIFFLQNNFLCLVSDLYVNSKTSSSRCTAPIPYTWISPIVLRSPKSCLRLWVAVGVVYLPSVRLSEAGLSAAVRYVRPNKGNCTVFFIKSSHIQCRLTFIIAYREIESCCRHGLPPVLLPRVAVNNSVARYTHDMRCLSVVILVDCVGTAIVYLLSTRIMPMSNIAIMD